MSDELEKSVQSKAIEFLSLQPDVELIRVSSTRKGRKNNGPQAGVSDVIGCGPGGAFFACEFKRPKGGVVSDAQRRFAYRIARCGGEAIFAKSVADVEEMLTRMRRKVGSHG